MKCSAVEESTKMWLEKQKLNFQLCLFAENSLENSQPYKPSPKVLRIYHCSSRTPAIQSRVGYQWDLWASEMVPETRHKWQTFFYGKDNTVDPVANIFFSLNLPYFNKEKNTFLHCCDVFGDKLVLCNIFFSHSLILC